jgi:hypothetical protein
MSGEVFKVWRVLEEEEQSDETGQMRSVIVRKELVGEILNPAQEAYVTWPELRELYGEGYYLVDVPESVRRQYLVADKQFIRTPGGFEGAGKVLRRGNRLIYDGFSEP